MTTRTNRSILGRLAFWTALGALCLGGADSVLAVDPPRSGSGRPDFSGVWFYGSATPFERPEALGEKLFYSEAEAHEVMARLVGQESAESRPSDPDRSPPPKGAAILQEADHNFAPNRVRLTRIDGRFRTSLIVDPPNGRLPRRAGAKDYLATRLASGFGAFDDPELRPASERCLSVVGPMAPMLGWFYNANMRIVQTEDYLMLNGEMLPPRIIPLKPGGRSALDSQSWEGESTAAWDGSTLRVTTSGFRPESSWKFFEHSDRMEVVETFELVSADEIRYRYTVTDDEIYSAPFTVEMSISRRAKSERIYEFACHEGNHAFAVILRGARVQEREQLTGGGR